ncbi:MAG: hypothetical protein ACP5DX_00400 [Paracoccaceae bacterium]
MTPRFSLTLSHEGIGLLHRTKTGWSEVGQVALDDPNLSQALKMLRDTASALEGGGVLSELVIPDGQILYTRLTPEGPLGEQSLRAALEGLTPYAVDELVFDWEADGDGAQVAVVARETLAEAEAFAVEHRFNPVGFTARPTTEQFPRAPWFGPTKVSASLLPEGETPEPAVEGKEPAPEATPEVEGIADEGQPAGTAPEARPADAEAPEDAAPAPPEQAPETAADDARPDTGTEPPDEAPEPAETPSPPEQKPLISPLPAPEDRPAFASRRDHSAAPSADIPQPSSTKARLTLAPGKPVEAPDIAGGKIGITAPEAPETNAPSGRSRKGAAKKQKPKAKAGRKPSRPAPPKAEPAKATLPQAPAARAPAPVTTPVAPPPPGAAGTGDAPGLPGGLFAPEPPSSGLPRLGLALTGVLLVALLLVALWALFLRDPGESTADNAALPAETEQLALAPQAAEEEPAAPSAPAEDAAEQPPAGTMETEPEPDAPETAQPLSPEQLDTLYAATGIYAAAPDTPEAPAQDQVDDIYIASLDPRVAAQDAIALPEAPIENHDARPPTPANPPGPGNVFELDSRGLVRPSPEGTLNPEGITVFSGPPRITPPERPESDIAVDPAEAAEAERLGTIRPRTRPEDLSEQNERANLGGLTRAELSTRRPLARPQSLQEQAMAEAEAEAAADGAEDIGASELAVASSRKPQARPGDFAALVEKAVKEAQSAPAAVVPASATVTPRIPSSASVAKQATLPNAINLRDLNLIGIYGSASNRRALVRLKSGRYVKVQVGDRLDGGQVTAISADVLRYTKRGREHVLEMPEG